jgi:hypothetical protein
MGRLHIMTEDLKAGSHCIRSYRHHTPRHERKGDGASMHATPWNVSIDDRSSRLK